MKIPQILVIGILAMSLGIKLADASGKGESRGFWIGVISTAIWIGLLTWGGFWK